MNMKPNFTLIATGMFLSLSSFGQNVKPQVEKAISIPSMKDNSAKADVYFHKKEMIDSSNLIDKPKPGIGRKSKSKQFFKKKSKSV